MRTRSMKSKVWVRSARSKLWTAFAIWVLTVLMVTSPSGQQGGTIRTPTVPLELPVEVELELAPGSLKDAPLWHEIAELLENPYDISCPNADNPATPDFDESVECVALTDRRRSFLPPGCSYAVGAPVPCDDSLLTPLDVWSPHFNPLTGQPMRLRTSDGEISWDQPGPLFGPDDGDPTTPVTEVIGALVVDGDNNLVVSNPDNNPDLPADGTIVAVPAFNAQGEIVDADGAFVAEIETPISELDFFRHAPDVGGIPVAIRPYTGRLAAQVLGKALFWDMQVGSDGVQACGSCHFHAGTDNRSRNQLNPNHLGGDLTLQVHAAPNQDLVASDYPFRKLQNPDLASEGDPAQVVERDANDVMSSMGVRFRKFGDIPRPGGGITSPAFLQVAGPVRPLAPDCPVPDGVTPQRPGCAVTGPADPTSEIDPIPVFQGLRRVEPRNTPTIFGVAFNFDNFWDGRARHDANGGSVFGPADPQFHIFINGSPSAGISTPTDPPRGAEMEDFRPDLAVEDPELAEQPVRIRFSSLASLATGPALSDFEMSFAGRNWPKLGKKLLQTGVTPLANQLVDPDDSVLGPFSAQRSTVGGSVNRPGRPGLNVTYTQLIQAAFIRNLWSNSFGGANTFNAVGSPAPCTSAVNGALSPPGCDPFDGYVLSDFVCCFVPSADASNTNLFRQIEANFSLFFGLSLQAWQEVLIPDNTPFDQFMDVNPLAGNGVAQPGELNTLHPNEVKQLVTGSPTGNLTLVPGFGEDEVFGFDIFAGANLTAALPVGSARNPAGMGSNPFHRTGRCMICHIGPEQTDHTNNVNAGLLQGNTEFEFPVPPTAPEPTGPFRLITGIALGEEVIENAQDGVEVENRNFAIQDDPATPWHEGQIGSPSAIAFQDNGVYNIGVRPTDEDIMRGGTDAFGWPLSLAALALKNLAGPDYEPCDDPGDAAGPAGCALANFDPSLGVGGGLFEESGADQRINPGLEMQPAVPLLPAYLSHFANNLPAGEKNPEIDELAFAPNTITESPVGEFAEVFFGADPNCGTYDPAAFGAGPPNFGWGPQCPNAQSGVPVNFESPLNGTWPFANRVARNGAVKAPQLRNVELTGPYFHTGSFLTLRQVVDFYMRGGDFPLTNAEDRDPNLVNIGLQAFGFGTTVGLPAQFQDGVPDAISQYGPFPDTTATTPEPANATPEAAKIALVKFLLALTDSRVKFEQAPFDHPEIFVPLDGTAPDNGSLAGAAAGGRDGFVNNLANGMFRQIRAVGAGGNAVPLPGFLGVTSNPAANCSTEISHFCR